MKSAARYGWRGKAWSLVYVVPTIAAGTYLERVRYCVGEARVPEGCGAR